MMKHTLYTLLNDRLLSMERYYKTQASIMYQRMYECPKGSESRKQCLLEYEYNTGKARAVAEVLEELEGLIKELGW